MAKEFLFRFSGQAFSVGQLLAFSFNDKVLGIVVKDMEGKFPPAQQTNIVHISSFSRRHICDKTG